MARSLPLRECGLKYSIEEILLLQEIVTPLAGVWIEIISLYRTAAVLGCHSPCGSVD